MSPSVEGRTLKPILKRRQSESLLCRPSKHCKIGPEQLKILASLEAREQTNMTFIYLIFCVGFLRLVATFLQGNQVSPLLRNNWLCAAMCQTLGRHWSHFFTERIQYECLHFSTHSYRYWVLNKAITHYGITKLSYTYICKRYQCCGISTYFINVCVEYSTPVSEPIPASGISIGAVLLKTQLCSSSTFSNYNYLIGRRC